MHPYNLPKSNGIRYHRWAFGILLIIFCGTLLFLLRMFYVDNTVVVPSEGGTYIEASVGELQPLNPWFTVTNDVNKDIESLVFSGLLKYNPETKRIEDDLATLLISDEGRIYDLTLKDNIFWHDSTEENPHPVTSDDVLFTFQSVQNSDFPNPLLRQNFQGVQIEKINSRSVRFKLEEPYSFFASNLTLGLLPARSFEGIPTGKLDQALDFGFNPIGAGPYKFKGLVQTELSTEVTLERFERSLEPSYHLERVVFRIFPDYATLLSDIRNVDGIRMVPRNEDGDPLVPRRFKASQYSLPQYVALFFNLDRSIVQDKQLRLGLQLGTDKKELVDFINESLIVDTPLLELDLSDWRYLYDPEAAKGSFFESNWNLPEKVRLQKLLEIREANAVGALTIAPVVLLDTGAVLQITGSLLDASMGSTVNGVPVVQHPANSGSWIVGLPTHGGTGSIQLGMNVIRLENENGKTVDSFYVWRTGKGADYKRAIEEQRLVDVFIASREGKVDDEHSISVQDLYLEKGMLRQRMDTDPVDVRINDSGDKLSLTILTSNAPVEYEIIANALKEQWAKLGVHVGIVVPETRQEFEEKLVARDYDILLFGQSLLDNLDSYPYWHSSGMQKLSDNKYDLKIDAYNLSQYSSLKADSLLELIRQTSDDRERQEAFQELREVLKEDIPAIFLYSPLYTFAHHTDVRGISLGALSMHSDRFLSLHKWYLKEERLFKPDKSWWSFFGWMLSL